MVLFLTNTATQFMNAIIIKNTLLQDEVCDVYYTDNLSDYARKAQEFAVFNNSYQITLVKDICARDSHVKKAIVRIKNGLDFSEVMKMLPSDPMQYSRVFASGISLRNYEYYYAIKSKNQNVKLSLFEEGLCEYYNLSLPHSFARSAFSHLFFRHYYLEECDSLYVYTPEAVSNTWPNVAIKKIPYVNDQTELITLLNKIFRYEPKEMVNTDGKVVILEQAFYEDVQIKNQEEIIRVLSEVFGKDRIIIKLHPRSEANKYGQGYQYVKTNIPFEIIAINEDVDKDAIYVSISSSAVLNFKLMLNKEPKAIVLNRFNKSDEKKNESQSVFDYVKNAYTENRFYMPLDDEELIEAAKALSM